MFPRVLLLTNEADLEAVGRELDEGTPTPFVRVETARTIGAALRMLAESAYHAVVLDFDLPESDGLRALMAVRDAAPEAGVVICVGDAHHDWLVDLLASGADEYIAKHANDAWLTLRAIRHAIEKRTFRGLIWDAESRSRELWRRTAAGLLDLDLSGVPRDANPALTAMLNLQTEDEVIELDLRHDVFERPVEFDEWLAHMRSGRGEPRTLRLKTPGGLRRSLTTVGYPSYDRLGVPVGYHVTVTAAAEPVLRAEVPYAACHEPLTGLYDERMFLQQLVEAVRSMPAGPSALFLCHLEVEGFDEILRLCGRCGADECLKAVAGVLTAFVGRDGIAARIEGHEFALLLAAGESEARESAARLAAAIRSCGFVWAAEAPQLAVSIGMVRLGASVAEIDRCRAAAQEACHEARRRPDMTSVLVREAVPGLPGRRYLEMRRAARVKAAVASNALSLWQQPIEPLRSSSSLMPLVEVFVRLVDECTYRAPTEFFGDAARYNLGTMIDRWVVDSLLRPACGMDVTADPVRFSMNVFPQSVDDQAFVAVLDKALGESAIAPGALCFEVPENVLVERWSGTCRFVRALRERGVAIAVDGLGAGPLPHAHLQGIAPNYMKLHPSITSVVHRNRTARAAVLAMVEMARSWGGETVATGIERDGGLFAVEELGVDYAQGKAVQAPLPLSDLLVQRYSTVGVGAAVSLNRRESAPAPRPQSRGFC